MPHIVWNACSNVEFLKGAKRTTSLTWSQLCLFLAQLVCCRRYTCSELLSNEEDIIWTDHYFLVTWGSVDQQWSALPRDLKKIKTYFVFIGVKFLQFIADAVKSSPKEN